MTTETDTADAVADDALLLDDTADQQGQDTQPADDAGADTVEAGEGNDAPKPKQTAQERIDELTGASARRPCHSVRRPDAVDPA